jgi:hypothetical protein
MDANKLIEATRLQSLWISSFKKSLATMTVSKVLARWLETTLLHTTKETRLNAKYRPALGKGHDMYYQEACTVKNYKKKIIHTKEKTNRLMDTLTALQVPLGMHTPKTHLTSLQGRTS